jgi:hypothetical protein
VIILAQTALVVASIADVLTTRAGLRTGLVIERNPLMCWATDSLWRAVFVKAAGLAVAFLMLAELEATMPRVALAMTWGFALLTAGIAHQNHRLVSALTAPTCILYRDVRDSPSSAPLSSFTD